MIPTLQPDMPSSATTEQLSAPWPDIPYKLTATETSGVYLCPPATSPTVETELRPEILSLLWRLHQLRLTPPGNRGQQVDWPAEKAFVDARNFAVRMPAPLKSLPHISLADDGEVNFAWTREGIYLDLGFYGAETFSFYGNHADGRESFGDDIPVKHDWPEDLTQLISG